MARKNQIKLLEENLERERKRVEVETEILTSLPEDLDFHNFHATGCYGESGWLTFGNRWCSSFDRKPDTRLSRLAVAKLLYRYPPIPMRYWKSGCTYLVPTCAKNIPPDDARYIWGVTVRVEDMNRVQWYAFIDAQTILKFQAVLLPDQTIADRLFTTKNWGTYGPVRSIESWRLIPRDGAWVQNHIKWSSGAPENPSPATLYWEDVDLSKGAKRIFLEDVCNDFREIAP